MITKYSFCAFLFLLPFLYIGCSSDQQPPNQQQSISNQLEVRDAWVRAAAKDANSAGYLKIVNGTMQNDTLLAVQAEDVNRSEVHESFTTAEGLSGMRPADSLVIAPGSTLLLQPGSFHLMLMGIEKEFQAGDSLQISLQFSQAGTITKEAEVRN